MQKIGRRSFLSAAAMTAAGSFAAGAAPKAAKGRCDLSGDVKFCVFADIHYSPGTFPHSTKEWLMKILEHAEQEKCDFIIHCGDFCHRPVQEHEYVEVYNAFGSRIPVYHVIGNHDDDGNSHDETLSVYGMNSGHYFFERNGFRFVVLDPNHIRYADGRIEHYSNGNYYKKKKGDVISYVPPAQLAWLKTTLEESNQPCVLFSHQSLERPAGNSCSNNDEVRAIIDAANAAVPGKVRMAINGHHHSDFHRIIKGVTYFDLNSAHFYWIGSAYNNTHYPESFFVEHGMKPKPKVHWASYEYPLHAIVHMTGAGVINVKGTYSHYSLNVTPEMVGFVHDACGRIIPPSVSSFEVDMDFDQAT